MTGSTPLSTPFDPSHVSVSFIPPVSSANPSPLPLLVHSKLTSADEAHASEILEGDKFVIVVDLSRQGVGRKELVKYWMCDFSHVSIFHL